MEVSDYIGAKLTHFVEMEELDGSRLQSPWLNVILIILVSLFGFIFIGPVIGLFLALPFYEGTAFTFMEDLSNPLGKENLKLPLMILQGSATFIGLTLVPAYFYYWYKSKKQSVFGLINGSQVSVISLLLLFFIVVFFMGFNSIFIEWNANLDLPDFLGEFERLARSAENRAIELTKYLTSFASTGEFVVGFIVIAIFPAIGEELVFRGMLQPELYRATKNIHASIWISAILFSALHLQFFGFVPRVLLGALFGYLYYWSGNLIIPIAAHFINNGLSVTMIYLNKTEFAGVDLEGTEAAPWPVVTLFSLMAGLLLYYFRKIHNPSLH